LFGFLIIVAVIGGVVRTFLRRDLTTRAKLVGRSKKALAVPSAASTTLPAPGWYADPSGHGQMRWYDGARWTDAVIVDGQQQRDPSCS
jgi:Protein of unknown function (DUF2510)